MSASNLSNKDAERPYVVDCGVREAKLVEGTMSTGASFRVILVESKEFALVQPSGREGWRLVWLSGLPVDADAHDPLTELVAAVIDEAAIRNE